MLFPADGSTSAFNGSADNDIYSVALYGTYMAQNGVYVDVVGKYSNIAMTLTRTSPVAMTMIPIA